MKFRVPLLLLVFALLGETLTFAHEARPGYLELTETAPDTYTYLWKRPTGGEVELQLTPIIPADCKLTAPDQQQLTVGAVVVRGTLDLHRWARWQNHRDRRIGWHHHRCSGAPASQ